MRAHGEKGKKVTKIIEKINKKLLILLSPKPPRGLFIFVFRGMFGRALTSVPCGLMGRKWWWNQEGKKKVNPLERGWGWTTLLMRVKIFYFYPFLGNSKLYFCAHKSRFAKLAWGWSQLPKFVHLGELGFPTWKIVHGCKPFSAQQFGKRV